MTANFLRIGHRGAAAYATENTLSSIETAIACNVDMVELDVRRTKDGHLILAHDTHLHADGRKLKISKHTLAELEQLCLPGGELVTTLESALCFMNGKVLANIDLKVKGTESEIVELMKNLNMTSNIMFSGLHLKSLQKIKTALPDSYVVLSFPSSSIIKLYDIRWLRPLFNTVGNHRITRACIDFAIRQLLPIKARRLKLDLGIDGVMIRAPFISSKLVDIVHQKEMKLFAWPADKVEDVARLQKMGVDGAGSNRPDILNSTKRSQHLAAQ